MFTQHISKEINEPVEAIMYGKLQKLLSKDPNDLLLSLLCPRSGFKERLAQSRASAPMVHLLLTVIEKVCQAQQTEGKLLQILSLVADSCFMKEVLCELLFKYFNIEPVNDPDHDSIQEILDVLEHLIKWLPMKSQPIVTVLLVQIKAVIQMTSLECVIAIRVSNAVMRLEQSLADIIWRKNLGYLIKDPTEDFVIQNQGEAFRRMSIIPTYNDLRSTRGGYRPINKNIIFGKYKDVSEYLDVQFRLLREDLIQPLREGFNQLIEIKQSGSATYQKTHLKVYKEVRIISLTFGRSGIIHRVQFDMTPLKRVCWKLSKRLCFGSLVCLFDEQLNTVLFATIVERDLLDKLKTGEIGLHFEEEDGFQYNKTQLSEVYTMIESPSYFESYRHVLKSLQLTTDSSLPFSDFILNHRENGEPIMPPNYLKNGQHLYNFSRIMVDRSHMKPSEPLNFSTWPTAEQLNLDDSQYNALKCGLTKELAIIQGPPGTGKTFIGLKIVEVLLSNERVWNPRHQKAPILIVCYTNHALDQFLEGILDQKLINSNPGSLVRIGSRSKSEKLKSCNLADIKHEEFVYNKFASLKYAVKDKLEIIKSKILNIVAYIDLSKVEIINEWRLESCITDQHASSLLQYRTDQHASSLLQYRHETGSILLLWLTNKSRPFISQKVNSLNDFNKILYENKVRFFTECYHQVFEDDEMDSQRSNFETVKFLTKLCGDFILEKHDGNVIPVKELRLNNEIFRSVMTSSEATDCLNVWNLNQTDRWRLYNFWVSQLVEPLIEELNVLCREYDAEQKIFDEIVQDEDYDIVSNSKILGMTTSGSAKYRQLLERVKPRIIIVEEAAEVFEAHIVTSLNSSCEHLILIGDHQQLRPTPSVYELGTKFHLDISLFERFILNKLPCERLNVQHRMCPEISELIVPYIYKGLKNSDSVVNYEGIYGILGNVFFIDHAVEEQHSMEEDSYSNKHEAKFMSALCLYLLKVGYYPEKITVLTTYTGQIRLLRKYMPKDKYRNVCITSVDNYQGEENDIILLSLVRSNKESKIGFLSISNRVCVALSRAKKGFFIIGNASLLGDVSVLWHNILGSLRQQKKVVEKLPLACHQHSKNVYYVASEEDFLNVPFGGCSLPCDYRLDCGHVCGLLCHPFNQEHKQYNCAKPCLESCSFGHLCIKTCCEECGNCLVLLEKTLSRCQHTAKMACYQDEKDFQCKILIERILSRCNHTVKLFCYIDENNYKCQERCTKSCAGIQLSHPCTKKCYEQCYDCNVLVERILPTCGHKKYVPCHILETMLRDTILCTAIRNLSSIECIKPGYKPCYQFSSDDERPHMHCLTTVDDQTFKFKQAWKKFNQCIMPCKRSCKNGHPCTKLCCEICEKCPVKVDKILPRCEHVQQMSCYVSPDLAVCKAPCERTLVCSHKCKKRCGEACTVVCEEIVSHDLLPCLHIAAYHCWERKLKYPKSLHKYSKTKHEYLKIEHDYSKIECDYSKSEGEDSKSEGECSESDIESMESESEDSKGNQFIQDIEIGMQFNNVVQKDKKWTLEVTGQNYTLISSRICKNVCNDTLECGHACTQRCFICTSSGKHNVCYNPCSKQLPFCSHPCAGICGYFCQVCPLDCELSCRHSRCRNKCSRPCKPCKEPCDWRCSHKNCDLICSEPCTRVVCNEPCERILKCKHVCMGLCGETCLDICVQCHSEQFVEIEREFPECEISETTRYIQLLPCYHVFPVDFLDNYVKNNTKTSTYSFKSYLSIYCPLYSCRKEVKICPRFNAQIKRLKSSQMDAKFKISQEVLKWGTLTDIKYGGLDSQLFGVSAVDQCKSLKIHAIYLWNECTVLESTVKENEESVSVMQIFKKIEVDLIECMKQEDASSIACNVVEMGRVYINLYVLHLCNTTIGPKLNTLDECKKKLTLKSNLKIGINARNMWKCIQTMSDQLKTQFHCKIKNKEQLDFTSFLDAPLTSTNQESNWISCTKGHAYVYKGETLHTDEEMDENCSTCHSISRFFWDALCPEKLAFIEKNQEHEEESSVVENSCLDQGNATIPPKDGCFSKDGDLPTTSKLSDSKKRTSISTSSVVRDHCDSSSKSQSRDVPSSNKKQSHASHPTNNRKSRDRYQSYNNRQSHRNHSSKKSQSPMGHSVKDRNASHGSDSFNKTHPRDGSTSYNNQSHPISNERIPPVNIFTYDSHIKRSSCYSELHHGNNNNSPNLSTEPRIRRKRHREDSPKRHGDSRTGHGDSQECHGDSQECHGDSRTRHGDSHERHGDSHERHGDSRTSHGDSQERHGNSHERHGDSHERHGDSHERHGNSHERHGDSHERCGDSRTRHGDSHEHHGDSQGHHHAEYKRRRMVSHERGWSSTNRVRHNYQTNYQNYESNYQDNYQEHGLNSTSRVRHIYQDLDAVCSEDHQYRPIDEHVLHHRYSHFQRYNRDEDNYFS